jgi:carbonic anhydrase
MMKKSILGVTAIVVVAGIAYAGSGGEWGYSGDQGPQHWGTLRPEFAICSTGKNQSPINLAGFIESNLTSINIQYQAGGNEVINNGNTIQVNFSPGSKISLEGQEFELKQYHFHAPSENHLNGRSYPMEAHLVHADQQGNLAVIGVMFVEGKANESLAQAWAKIPGKAGENHQLSPGVSGEGILPANWEYYRFSGSLTTPPCSEGVRWLVMKDPVAASRAQIEQFAQAIHHPNNRPLQAVNARTVLQ